MMEYLSSEKCKLVGSILSQIDTGISEIKEWNKDIACANDYLVSTEGSRNLAATSMLLSAIGEGLKRIDKLTNGELLPLRPEIPWKQVKGMRDHIAHGYFDIDSDLIYEVVKEELDGLQIAVKALKEIVSGK
ncbi:MAG: DUF86 domain-containing protein [Bacteroidaceae bacterium]|nr:DUF86 domain-containing protein [Bacteroidaceae bacterium]